MDNKSAKVNHDKLPYDINKIYRPLVAVDVVIFTINDEKLKLLLVKRGLPPFKGDWAIPGGFLKEGESAQEAAERELQEETGVKAIYLEQLYTFGAPKRDPRGRVISIAYFALVPASKIGNLKAATDATEAKWFGVKALPKLAFDHDKIVHYAQQRLQWKMEYTTAAYSLLDEEFTLTQMQRLYEIVFNKKFDKRNFRKKILSLNLIEPTGKTALHGVHRPAKTYCFIKKRLSLVDII